MDRNIQLKYDAPLKRVEVLVTGSVTDWPSLRVVKVDESGDDVETYIMKREGGNYNYTWTAEEDGTFDYYITNGYLYWDADGVIEGSAPDYTVIATGLNNSSWISEQTPFANNYPSGTNASAKLKINGGSDYWICFNNGGSYEFDWADRK